MFELLSGPNTTYYLVIKLYLCRSSNALKGQNYHYASTYNDFVTNYKGRWGEWCPKPNTSRIRVLSRKFHPIRSHDLKSIVLNYGERDPHVKFRSICGKPYKLQTVQYSLKTIRKNNSFYTLLPGKKCDVGAILVTNGKSVETYKYFKFQMIIFSSRVPGIVKINTPESMLPYNHQTVTILLPNLHYPKTKKQNT